MANPEHLKILKQGVEVWNRWREENPEIIPNLSRVNLTGLRYHGIDFHEVNLRSADLSTALLSEANFTQSDMRGCVLYWTKLDKANFNGAYMHESNLRGANLEKADFQDAYLQEVNFTDAILDKTNFTKTTIRTTVFGLTDLSSCSGLDSVRVTGPCIIDFYTLRASHNLPKSFLLKIGLPENYINYLPDFFDENPIRMYPVFLSHSWQNKDFANKLYEALIARGVQVWYDEKKMKPGDDIYESLSRGIEVYDKMILVCSRQSLSESWWVDREIDRTLAKERQLQKERGKRINLLIPIRIDNHIFEWDGAKSEEVRRYIIGDFRDWQDEAKFQKALDELIAALNVDRREDAPPSFL